jgi:hypothetical protein
MNMSVQILGRVVEDPKLTSEMKAIICERIATCEKKLLDGADEELQLMDLLICASRAVSGMKIEADKVRLIIV